MEGNEERSHRRRFESGDPGSPEGALHGGRLAVEDVEAMPPGQLDLERDGGPPFTRGSLTLTSLGPDFGNDLEAEPEGDTDLSRVEGHEPDGPGEALGRGEMDRVGEPDRLLS